MERSDVEPRMFEMKTTDKKRSFEIKEDGSRVIISDADGKLYFMMSQIKAQIGVTTFAKVLRYLMAFHYLNIESKELTEKEKEFLKQAEMSEFQKDINNYNRYGYAFSNFMESLNRQLLRENKSIKTIMRTIEKAKEKNWRKLDPDHWRKWAKICKVRPIKLKEMRKKLLDLAQFTNNRDYFRLVHLSWETIDSLHTQLMKRKGYMTDKGEWDQIEKEVGQMIREHKERTIED